MRKESKKCVVRRKPPTARKIDFQQMYNKGYNQGFDEAYKLGYSSGLAAGESSYTCNFQGTSIVIATTNDQRAMLQQCIESIRAYTPELHEIIIIDNGSTDDTKAYLKKQIGKIRYKILGRNLGFAGGMNQGLMMARGKEILFLNNDTVVTRNWLSNLQACLYSNPRFGLVGPVTNYISGEQLIETAYTNMEEMHQFAEKFNVSDPSKWHMTSRLTGFCVLMRREMLERLGYLDEGFEIGNCEDDDYGFRSRLLGRDLIIAKDTFIHHVGSVSIKALGERLEEVYSKNRIFYSRKWGETYSLLTEVQAKHDGSAISMNHFYPSHILVRGVKPDIYWIENGMRHPVKDAADLPSSRVSQVDLRFWPISDPITSSDLAQRLGALSQEELSEGLLREGMLVVTEEGVTYQWKNGKLQRFISGWSLSYWHLSERFKVQVRKDVFHSFTEGMPLIAPAVIYANNV